MNARDEAGSAAVLLVEPHEDTRTLYASYLTGEGCAVEVADDGPAALAKALSGRSAAIVIETRLPGIDGFELCRLLRRDPATRRAVVLFLTGDGLVTQEAASAGADAILLKPCMPEALLAELRH